MCSICSWRCCAATSRRTRHRRCGRRQWHYGPEVQELEAQLKAQQVYEQTNGQAFWSLGAAFWELRFPKG